MKVPLSAYRRMQHTRAPVIGVPCPRCGAIGGEPCIEPRGTVTELAHMARLVTLLTVINRERATEGGIGV